jgi:hypothetical protein
MILVIPIMTQSSLSQDAGKRATLSSSVVALAAANPVAFKEALVRITPMDREKVESMLRAAFEETDDAEVEAPTRPSIMLKSNFASD